VPRRRSVDSPQGEVRVGCAPRGPNAVEKKSRTSCFRPVAVLMRLRLVRRREDKARRELAHNNHAKSTVRDANSARRRPLLNGVIRARDARHGNQTRWLRHFESSAADWSQCWCGRASTDGVGRSSPRVGPHHIHAKPALRGACSSVCRPLLHDAIHARDARLGIHTRCLRTFEPPAADGSRCWCG